MAEPGRAAFFDVDGTLVRTNIVHAFAFYAMNQGSILGTAFQTARTVLSVPLFAAADKVNRKVFNELFYRYYTGQSEDRLETLAEELFEDVLRPAIYPGTPRLVDETRRAGCRVVLVTGALDFTVRRLAEHLGADDLIANRMRFVQGVATGRVIPPIIEGAHKALAIRDYCVREGLALEKSFAYSDSFSDYPMLAVVGHPAAVNPDARLARVARAYEWPVLRTTET
ncbi:HAD family phosphatase [Anaeromyxobacter sp. Fw109-5]|uniref:HAD family hydrolase n=1 Tax=Anaeromyxobacter sp. (strain Fw109-5) TaxID=404589 RepID=UPI0000ED8074|nr:HAD family hydrolase [Anaeromyxobacter sp. Fw109-5]ABS25422.1 HAD-superfamily subfamily IB hydrolase, TIGR01490 [Anaeromyxobacter sp. Fw109-5]